MSAGSTEAPPPRPANFDHRLAAATIDEEDWLCFRRLTSVELNEAEKVQAARPDRTDPAADEFLAVHWHPEWAPLDLIDQRLRLAFPAAVRSLAIPTQHNRLMSFRGWAGVEADVYDRRYGLKVQLLIHFPAERLPKASALTAMMDRTYNYRAHQLLDILKRLAEPDEVFGRVRRSLPYSVSQAALDMARFYAVRLLTLIEESGIIGGPADEMLKNRLLPDYLTAMESGRPVILDQALMLIKAVKKTVKAELNPGEFHSPQEVIEEARHLGGGVVIPHPPQFWPMLLSDLDVDGWEVWNPSTPKHAIFLTEALARANESRPGRRPLLAFMGDDTHMSAKFRLGLSDEKDSAGREIGFQDPWFDPAVKAALDRAGQSRRRTLTEYQERMGG
ncbi:hypothetical protein LJB86_03010 [Deltaproteobacteria bacterium OttesenSCG-928-M10]|nr:hypothetical protein [Deltaproteobacteria bacterium OttesenSCG-928-M10]